MANSRPLVALLLVVLSLASVVQRTAAKLSACPKSCQTRKSNMQIVSSSSSSLSIPNAKSISYCRSSCAYQSRQFYQFQSLGNKTICTCFSSCKGTRRVLRAIPGITGVSSSCPDSKCPVTCHQWLGFKYIDSPSNMTAHSIQPTVDSCRDSCQRNGTVYQYAGRTCNCFASCKNVTLIPGSSAGRPYQAGYLASCVLPPKTQGATCSKPTKADCGGQCPGSSYCVKSSLKGKYQCCCDKPNKSSVKEGVMEACNT